jgi:hypothetical protein
VSFNFPQKIAQPQTVCTGVKVFEFSAVKALSAADACETLA